MDRDQVPVGGGEVSAGVPLERWHLLPSVFTDPTPILGATAGRAASSSTKVLLFELRGPGALAVRPTAPRMDLDRRWAPWDHGW